MTTSASSACQALISRYVVHQGRCRDGSRDGLLRIQQPRGTHLTARGYHQESVLALLDNGDVSVFLPISSRSIGSHDVAASTWS